MQSINMTDENETDSTDWFEKYTDTVGFEYIVFGQEFIEAFVESNRVAIRIPEKNGKNARREDGKLIFVCEWEPVFIDPTPQWVYWLRPSNSLFLSPDFPCELCEQPIEDIALCWTQTSYKRMFSLGGFWVWIVYHGKTRHGHKGCLLLSRKDAICRRAHPIT